MLEKKKRKICRLKWRTPKRWNQIRKRRKSALKNEQNERYFTKFGLTRNTNYQTSKSNYCDIIFFRLTHAHMYANACSKYEIDNEKFKHVKFSVFHYYDWTCCVKKKKTWVNYTQKLLVRCAVSQNKNFGAK